jgi:hypothetical protein
MQKGILKKDDTNGVDESNWNLFSELETKCIIPKKPKTLVDKMYKNARRGNLKKTTQSAELTPKVDEEKAIEDYKSKRFGKNRNKK